MHRSILFTLMLTMLPWTAFADEELTIGIFSYRPKPIMETRWQPFESYMSAALPGYKVNVLPLSQDELEEALRTNKLDLFFTTPPHFLALRERNPLSGALATLVRTHNDVAVNALAGVMFRSKARTDIKTIHDLKNKKIAAMGDSYLGGYVSHAIELAKAGMSIKDLDFMFTGSPNDLVVEKVRSKEADVGFVRSGLLEQMVLEGKLNWDEIEVINPQYLPGYPYVVSTHLYPEWPMVALPHLSSEVTRKVASALLAIEPHSDAAISAGIYGFDIPASYAHLMESMKALRLAPYNQAPKLSLREVWQQYKLMIVFTTIVLVLVLVFLGVLAKRNSLIEKARKKLDEQNQFQTSLMKTLPHLVFFKDTEGVYRFGNATFERLYGAPMEQIIGKTDYDFVDKWLADFFRKKDKQAQENSHTTVNEEWLTFADDNTQALFETYKTPVRNQNGQLLGMLSVGHDITKQREFEHSLQLAASVFENTREGIVIADADGKILQVNDAFVEMFGYSEKELLGHSVVDFKNEIIKRKFYFALFRQVLNQDFWEDEFWTQTKQGTRIALHMSVVAIRNSEGGVINLLAVLSDITELKQHEEQLKKVAYFDPLTRLPNRRLLDDRLKLALKQAKRDQTLLAVVYLDLDGFKPINDIYSHEAGDQLLVEISERLLQAVREGDTVSRVGGDEFVLILNHVESILNCEAVLKRVLQEIETPVMVDRQALQVSASIGVTLFPEDDCDADTLLRHADQSMYIAKKSGKNAYHFFNNEQELFLELRQRQLKDIEAAILNKEFELYYQPKIELVHGEVVGFEALLRRIKPGWQQSHLKSMLEMLDGTPQEIALGTWVLNQALSQVQTWSKAGLKFPISVNVSPNHLMMPDFCESCIKTFSQYPRECVDLIEFEVLETTGIVDIERVARVLEEVSDYGIKIGLDDFGTGYSSLTHVRQFPIDYLKIDLSFVSDMFEDSDDMNMVKSIIHLAHSMNRQVIAEGAETDKHLRVLGELGCDMAQGYAIAKAMPPEQVVFWLRNYQSAHDA